MKILLSAFGCEPNRGSDTEVGWQWAVNLAREGHKVWVITRPKHRPFIEEELARLGDSSLDGLSFIYLDADWFVNITNKIKGRIYVYYYLWQWLAYRYVKKLHKEILFDLVHHVTWVSVRQPSFMGGLGIPFVFGPVAGGEVAPFKLRKGYSARQWRQDLLRDLVNFIVRIDPFMRYTFSTANKIFVTSVGTRNLVPKRYREKVKIRMAIGMSVKSDSPQVVKGNQTVSTIAPKILYVGRFVGWKGMHIGLRAFKKLKSKIPRASLTMVGKGPDERQLRKLADNLDIGDSIDWKSWMAQEELGAVYSSHDLFLFPSLHDSGGLVLLEAMQCGIPVVCLNLGGPGEIVDNSSGLSVDVFGKDIDSVANDLAEGIHNIVTQPDYYTKLSDGAKNRVSAFEWKSLVNDVYS